MFCGTPIQQAGAVAPPLVLGFPIAFVLFWCLCSWLLRGHGAGGEVLGKGETLQPSRLSMKLQVIQQQPTQDRTQGAQKEVKGCTPPLTISAHVICMAPIIKPRAAASPRDGRMNAKLDTETNERGHQSVQSISRPPTFTRLDSALVFHLQKQGCLALLQPESK